MVATIPDGIVEQEEKLPLIRRLLPVPELWRWWDQQSDEAVVLDEESGSVYLVDIEDGAAFEAELGGRPYPNRASQFSWKRYGMLVAGICIGGAGAFGLPFCMVWSVKQGDWASWV